MNDSEPHLHEDEMANDGRFIVCCNKKFSYCVISIISRGSDVKLDVQSLNKTVTVNTEAMLEAFLVQNVHKVICSIYKT